MALAILLVAPAIAPWDRTVHGAGEALVLGLVAGALLFAALARQGLPAGVFAAPPRRLAARSAILLAKSVQEEAVWRALVLGLLVAPLGRLAALVTSTLVFAGAHVPHQGRAALAQLLTGSTFGSVYLLTGRIHAAMAAHALYNVLVGAALLAEEPLSVLDNGRARTSVVASGESPVRRPMPPPSSTAQPPVVARLEGVSKSFGRTRALAGIDLELRRGEILALLGPNGAGKSTAVAILLGLRRPDAGEATLFDRDPRSPATRRQIGAVLQEISFPPGLRVRETVDLVRAHFNDPQRTDALLSRLGLESKADRDAGGLSGGQRRRLAVALALAGRPDVLFLDEPTAGLDAGARRSLLGDVVSFAGEGGAVLLTTQQLSEAEEIASRVVVLVEGRVLHEGTVKETRAHGGVARVVFRSSAPPPREGVISIESRGNRHVVLVDDPDTYVTRLVQQGVDFRELEVAHSSLEDAFVALTGEPQT